MRLANRQVRQSLTQRIIDRVCRISRDDPIVHGVMNAPAANKSHLQQAIDIQIYHHPKLPRGRDPCEFVPPELVIDFPGSEAPLKFIEEWLYNFELDQSALEKLFVTFVQTAPWQSP